MADEKFKQWWETAKRYDEFRGVSMPAAYAAWLAGARSVESTTTEITEEVSGVAPTEPTAQLEPVKKVGRYAAEGRNAKRQVKEREQEKVDSSPVAG